MFFTALCGKLGTCKVYIRSEYNLCKFCIDFSLSFTEVKNFRCKALWRHTNRIAGNFLTTCGQKCALVAYTSGKISINGRCRFKSTKSTPAFLTLRNSGLKAINTSWISTLFCSCILFLGASFVDQVLNHTRFRVVFLADGFFYFVSSDQTKFKGAT